MGPTSLCVWPISLAEWSLSPAVEDALTASLHKTMHDRDRREWGDSGNFKKGQRKPGIEFTGSEKNGGHQLSLRTTVYELNQRHYSLSVFSILCRTNQPSRDGEQQALSQCTLLLQRLPIHHSQSSLDTSAVWQALGQREGEGTTSLSQACSKTQVSQRPGKHHKCQRGSMQ